MRKTVTTECATALGLPACLRIACYKPLLPSNLHVSRDTHKEAWLSKRKRSQTLANSLCHQGNAIQQCFRFGAAMVLDEEIHCACQTSHPVLARQPVQVLVVLDGNPDVQLFRVRAPGCGRRVCQSVDRHLFLRSTWAHRFWDFWSGHLGCSRRVEGHRSARIELEPTSQDAALVPGLHRSSGRTINGPVPRLAFLACTRASDDRLARRRAPAFLPNPPRSGTPCPTVRNTRVIHKSGSVVA